MKLPHQIRGFLTSFANVIMTGRHYTRCVACSPSVVKAYRENARDFVLSVLNNPKTLEDITGTCVSFAFLPLVNVVRDYGHERGADGSGRGVAQRRERLC